MRIAPSAWSLALFATIAAGSPGAEPKPQEPDSPPKVEPRAADGDAPLPEGFPGATKPGAIEVKAYPAYRSAVAEVGKATTDSGDALFFVLFNHIQKNDIAMTAPVINTYKTPKMVETPGAKGDVAMEFLYRSPTQGKTGKDGLMVNVEDHPAETFLCLGFQGDMDDDAMRDGLGRLRVWLADHEKEWIEDGPPRRLGYHGPMTPAAERLWEVQIAVKKAKAE